MIKRVPLQTTVNPNTLIALEEIGQRVKMNRASSIDFAIQLAYDILTATYDRDCIPPASVSAALSAYKGTLEWSTE